MTALVRMPCDQPLVGCDETPWPSAPLLNDTDRIFHFRVMSGR